jgi:hypothetical protein
MFRECFRSFDIPAALRTTWKQRYYDGDVLEMILFYTPNIRELRAPCSRRLILSSLIDAVTYEGFRIGRAPWPPFHHLHSLVINMSTQYGSSICGILDVLDLPAVQTLCLQGLEDNHMRRPSHLSDPSTRSLVTDLSFENTTAGASGLADLIAALSGLKRLRISHRDGFTLSFSHPVVHWFSYTRLAPALERHRTTLEIIEIDSHPDSTRPLGWVFDVRDTSIDNVYHFENFPKLRILRIPFEVICAYAEMDSFQWKSTSNGPGLPIPLHCRLPSSLRQLHLTIRKKEEWDVCYATFTRLLEIIPAHLPLLSRIYFLFPKALRPMLSNWSRLRLWYTFAGIGVHVSFTDNEERDSRKI